MAGQEYLRECSHGARPAGAAFEWILLARRFTGKGKSWRILRLARAFTDVIRSRI